MAVRTFLLCLLLFSAAAGAPDDEKDPKQDPKFWKRVHGSLDKGVEWLTLLQSATGQFPAFEDQRGSSYALGMHALSLLALVKGSGDAESPAAYKGYKVLDTLMKRHRNRLYTYEVGVVLMVLDAKYNTAPRSKKAEKKKRRKKRKVSPADLKLVNELVRWLQTKQKGGGLWRYPQSGQDLSNTQYAALGLWSAHRLGVAINKGVVRRMLEETLRRQQKAGPRVPFIMDPVAYRKNKNRRSSTTIMARGWRYIEEVERVQGSDGTMREIKYPYSGSMTSAGVAILAIGRDILGKKDTWLTSARDAKIRKAMWEGLAWLQNNWDLYDNPGQPGNWPFYWIYGLERCARLSGIEYVGSRDWFAEGAERLIGDQKKNGAWPATQRMRPPNNQNVRWWSDQVDTCFAILFLSRSTPEIKTPPPAITPGR